MNKPFIAIEGPIGVGKSSLAHRLSKTFGFYEEKEIVDENPFLSDFYDDIEKWNDLGLKTKYYNTDLHKGCFALPNYVKEMLENVDE